MNIVIVGPGGIGGFYGMILHSVGCNVKFIARGETLEYLKSNKMKVTHENYKIEDKIDTYDIKDFVSRYKPNEIDAIFIATKSMSTQLITKELALWIKDCETPPYYISLQNGVENEDIMEKYYNKNFVIGGLTRLIVSHTVSLGHVHCKGEVQTLMGAVYKNKRSSEFLDKLKQILDKTSTTTILCEDIKKELWNKLIINNGVNAICALLEEESGVLLENKKTSKLIHNLMKEAAVASNAVGVNLTQEDADKMYELMKSFQSVKPSMWVDKENNRDLELDDICGVVIKNCEKQGVDAAYTRTIATALEFSYNKNRMKI
ncbi:MAG: ketopantoate reductase family protein [Campylobacterota bacterium]